MHGNCEAAWTNGAAAALREAASLQPAACRHQLATSCLTNRQLVCLERLLHLAAGLHPPPPGALAQHLAPAEASGVVRVTKLAWRGWRCAGRPMNGGRAGSRLSTGQRPSSTVRRSCHRRARERPQPLPLHPPAHEDVDAAGQVQRVIPGSNKLHANEVHMAAVVQAQAAHNRSLDGLRGDDNGRCPRAPLAFHPQALARQGAGQQVDVYAASQSGASWDPAVGQQQKAMPCAHAAGLRRAAARRRRSWAAP